MGLYAPKGRWSKTLGEKLDYACSILYCVGLATILLGLTIGDHLSGRNIAIVADGLMLFIAVIFFERKEKYLTLDLTLKCSCRSLNPSPESFCFIEFTAKASINL